MTYLDNSHDEYQEFREAKTECSVPSVLKFPNFKEAQPDPYWTVYDDFSILYYSLYEPTEPELVFYLDKSSTG